VFCEDLHSVCCTGNPTKKGKGSAGVRTVSYLEEGGWADHRGGGQEKGEGKKANSVDQHPL